MSATLLPRKRHTPDEKAGFVSRKMRCRLAASSGPGFTDETSCLLRTRLRMAILIVLVPFAIHFVKNVLQLGPAFDYRPLWLVFGGCETVVLAGAAGLLWSRWPLSLCALRKVELTIFGSIAAFFAWLQIETYHDGALLRAIVPGEEAVVYRLVGLAGVLRLVSVDRPVWCLYPQYLAALRRGRGDPGPAAR